MVRTHEKRETPGHHADPRRPHRDPAQPGPLHVRADREGVRDRADPEPGEAGLGRAASALIDGRAGRWGPGRATRVRVGRGEPHRRRARAGRRPRPRSDGQPSAALSGGPGNRTPTCGFGDRHPSRWTSPPRAEPEAIVDANATPIPSEPPANICSCQRCGRHRIRARTAISSACISAMGISPTIHALVVW
jgi:hypothetical protein